MGMHVSDHDVIVIGGGSGGIAMANRAASYGARCALVEANALGGTCVHAGCVPKKIMFNAAQLATAMTDYAPDYGLPQLPLQVDYARLRASRQAYIHQVQAAYTKALANNGVDVIAGFGRLLGNQQVRVGTQVYRAQHIVLAVGGAPVVPDIPGAAHGITSDGFFALDALPKHVAIIGGGYIAVELAGVLHGLGVQVAIFVRQGQLLGNFDATLSDTLTEIMRAQGIALHFQTSISALQKQADGRVRLQFAQDQGQSQAFDTVIWAVGRRPRLDNLGLQEAGIRCDDKGFVAVDAQQNTNVQGVYAVGDITGQPALTPVAVAAGRQLAERLFNAKALAKVDTTLVPTVVFSHPPIASIGLSEQQARADYGDAAVKVYQTRFTPLFSAVTAHRQPCVIKLICAGADEKIIGLHGIGHGVDEMLQGFAVALRMGACKRDFDNTLAIHPTVAEEVVTLR